MARLLLKAETMHCCLGLHADDEGDGGLLLSLFTLAWRATDWAPRSVLAARAVELAGSLHRCQRKAASLQGWQ
jgi:hypothetical protein